jgi:hypothetical protein
VHAQRPALDRVEERALPRAAEPADVELVDGPDARRRGADEPERRDPPELARPVRVHDVGVGNRAREPRQLEETDASARRDQPHLEAVGVEPLGERAFLLAQHRRLEALGAQPGDQHLHVGLAARQAARPEDLGDAQWAADRHEPAVAEAIQHGR